MAAPHPAFGDAFRLTLITNDPVLAGEADRASIDRIGIDLEMLGKAERQAGHNTRLSHHSWDDLAAVASAVRRAALFVRINPVHASTRTEIETSLELGARVLMLPNFSTADEVATFVQAVRGRAHVMILLERAPAVARIREILAVRGVDEVMLGLNDLHFQFGLANPFEILTSPVVEMLSAEVRSRGLLFGMGGLGRHDDTGLPIPPDLVYAQYPRLGASAAWIARSFTRMPSTDFTTAARELRSRLTHWSTASTEALEKARRDLADVSARWRPNASQSPLG